MARHVGGCGDDRAQRVHAESVRQRLGSVLECARGSRRFHERHGDVGCSTTSRRSSSAPDRTARSASSAAPSQLNTTVHAGSTSAGIKVLAVDHRWQRQVGDGNGDPGRPDQPRSAHRQHRVAARHRTASFDGFDLDYEGFRVLATVPRRGRPLNRCGSRSSRSWRPRCTPRASCCRSRSRRRGWTSRSVPARLSGVRAAADRCGRRSRPVDGVRLERRLARTDLADVVAEARHRLQRSDRPQRQAAARHPVVRSQLGSQGQRRPRSVPTAR